ncbi:hypothetical protein [Phytoactinopolyspora limicola]|uniref:hypothetical protein n=1 Tax=Phytoactinopolyspora limicola TaxID=2715536 RepID=UPI00140E5847|nr:hypothetical protein [Phytoactinopolyspora limicola]
MRVMVFGLVAAVAFVAAAYFVALVIGGLGGGVGTPQLAGIVIGVGVIEFYVVRRIRRRSSTVEGT